MFKLDLNSDSGSDSDSDYIDDEGQSREDSNEGPIITEKQNPTTKKNSNTGVQIKTNNDKKQNKHNSTGDQKTWEDLDFSMFIENESISRFSDATEEYKNEKSKTHFTIAKKIIRSQQAS